jgi:hypothetical protein
MSCSEIKIKISESVKNLNLTVEYEYLNMTIWCAIFKAWNTVSVLIFKNFQPSFAIIRKLKICYVTKINYHT